jgi:hypothetical protein
MSKDMQVTIAAQGEQLLLLGILGSLNAKLIQMGLAQRERLQKLKAFAIRHSRIRASKAVLRAFGIARTEGEA